MIADPSKKEEVSSIVGVQARYRHSNIKMARSHNKLSMKGKMYS